MGRLPLNCHYIYHEEDGLYHEINSHRKLTIAEYEKLEKSWENSTLCLLIPVAFGFILIIALIIADNI
jgi:hypothetical protein